MNYIKEIKTAREKVSKELNRPLTEEEENIVRIAFLYGTHVCTQEMLKDQFEADLKNHEGPFI